MKPKLSVICLAYNQQDYIRQALDGFVMQKTNFPFEVIVHDDASTDKTADIIREYQKRYPDIIKPIFQTENQFSRGSNIMTKFIWPNVRGKYVAMCDGDDYWTDGNKLQKQVDFLDTHPDYTICFHPVQVFWDDNKEPEYIYPKNLKHVSLENLMRVNFIPNCSVVYRWCNIGDQWPLDIYPWDWYVHLWHAKNGKIGFIPSAMARYRRQPGGISFAYTNGMDALHMHHGIKEMNFFIQVEKNIAPNPVQYHKFVCERATEIFGAYARNKKFDLATQVMQMCPDLIQNHKKINEEARRWHHRFNKLLIFGGAIIALLVILIIKG